MTSDNIAGSETGSGERGAGSSAPIKRIEVSFELTANAEQIPINPCECAMDAIIIYDEASRAREASLLLKRASARADESTQWNFSAWRLDMLEFPRLAEEALERGQEAHLLVLAVAPREELPSSLLAWLEAWACHRHVDGAVLALFNGGRRDALAATATPALLDLTARHGLSFICDDITPADHTPEEAQPPRTEPGMAYAAAAASNHGEPGWGGYQHWGINE
ncbi:MAG TPA: hypothetical protein PKI20_11100 [Verrucomicrobiota bacterium]|nr:hypothetical protein [Verrucomicrobiota bacterium]HQL78139.1 hypothetical protein [Verrucomicrobiota bacterium]